MSFRIAGLSPDPFQPLFGLSDAALAERGVLRKFADKRPGFPCRISLEDAASGEAVLLLNYESHSAPTPYRSAYAIYVREGVTTPACYEDEIPPVMRGRPLAFRHFDKEGMLVGASLALEGGARDAIQRAFENAEVEYIHAHNAAHGCFAAQITRIAK